MLKCPTVNLLKKKHTWKSSITIEQNVQYAKQEDNTHKTSKLETPNANVDTSSTRNITTVPGLKSTQTSNTKQKGDTKMEIKQAINIGNVSSILKTIGLIIAGYLITFLASKGINLPIQQEQLATIIGILIGAILSYIDMKYQNSFFNKETDTISIPVPVELTPEQEQQIINLIHQYTEDEDQIEQIEILGDEDDI